MKDILVPISPGELLDKITILRIKAKWITDPKKIVNVQHELELLEGIWKDAIPSTVDLSLDEIELQAVNELVWDTVESIHRCEAEGRFNEFFMTLARRVCVENDRRAAIKKRINSVLGSALTEEKSHQ